MEGERHPASNVEVDFMGESICLIFLYILAVQDYQEHLLSEKTLLAFAIIGMGWQIYQKTFFHPFMVLNLIPGTGLLLLGAITNEKIGYGDGLVILIMGLYISGYILMYIILLGFLFAAFYGILNYTKKHQAKKINMEIPYIPFLLIGMVVMTGVK